MSPQRYLHQGVDLFNQLIAKIETTWRHYHNPETPPADPEQAGVQARIILKNAAQDIKAALDEAGNRVDAVLDGVAEKIAQKLSALPKPVPGDVGLTEFHTTGHESAAHAGAGGMQEDPTGSLALVGVHPAGMAPELHVYA
ncbi:MAG: hypothetical protein ABWY08_15725 [Comamonas sp.]